jgi:hypothetical protein
MKNKRLTAALACIAIAVMACFSCVSEAEQVDTERLIRRMTPSLAIVKETPVQDEMYFDSYYEPSDILQGNRTGHWSEITGTYGYTHDKIRGYGSFTRYERFDDKDFTANLGAYFNFPDSYLHSEIGAGWYTNYIYHLQVTNEYGHKLFRSVFWQMGYNFRSYETGNTHVAYPGLIYYFGDSYLSANYGATWIEGRGTGSFGNFRGEFAITDFLHLYSGVAVGQWLYDIYGLAPSEEFGYILSVGLNAKIYKGINARVGYSYSMEDPKFIKRSLSFGLSAKF